MKHKTDETFNRQQKHLQIVSYQLAVQLILKTASIQNINIMTYTNIYIYILYTRVSSSLNTSSQHSAPAAARSTMTLPGFMSLTSLPSMAIEGYPGNAKSPPP